MRVRNWVLIAVVALALGVAGCSARVARDSQDTPVPTKTLRPTFTATVAEPTLTPSPTAAPATETPKPMPPTEEPTPEPSPTLEPATFTVTSASLNVRSGPGTGFGVIGRLISGQSFPISGKNQDGSWWQFDYNGQTGWVVGSNVSTTAAGTVEVAQNIPALPTAAPRPTARPVVQQPRPAQPAQPTAAPQPQAAQKFALTGKAQLRPNTNPIISVWCFVLNQAGTGLVGGTMRVLQGGATVREQAFNSNLARGDSGYSSEYLYNDGCKVELPAGDGGFSAYLIEGGAQVSDVFNFTVSGETNRTAIIEWKLR